MKTLSIINLHKAEIKKNQLAKIKGGADVKCYCTVSNPHVTIKKQGGSTRICICDGTTTEAGIFNRKGE